MYRDVLFEFHLKFFNTASIGIPVRLLNGITAQPKGTTAQFYSNKTSLYILAVSKKVTFCFLEYQKEKK